MITACIFAEDNDPLLDDFTLKRWGSTLTGIKKHTKNKKDFSEQKRFQENICIFFCVPDFYLSALYNTI